MFVLTCKVEIGNYVFHQVAEIEITKSVDEMSDTAIIKLPTRFKVRDNGEDKVVETAIKIGDKVVITLGYKGHYSGVDFVGYVKKISPKIPVEIHCEDAIWLLRRKNITNSWEHCTLRDLLEEVVKDTPLQLADNIPTVKLDKWIIKNANGAQVLESIRKDLLMSVFINDEGKLYCGLEQLTNVGQTVVYDLNYNLVSNDLDYKTEEDRRVKIEYEYIDPKTNKRKFVEVGDTDGEKRSFKTSKVSNEADLKKMAEAELKKMKYEGFDGDVTSFLVPYSTRGMKAKLFDAEHPQREGNYFIKKVVTTFGTAGARRKVSLANKL